MAEEEKNNDGEPQVSELDERGETPRPGEGENRGSANGNNNENNNGNASNETRSPIEKTFTSSVLYPAFSPLAIGCIIMCGRLTPIITLPSPFSAFKEDQPTDPPPPGLY